MGRENRPWAKGSRKINPLLHHSNPILSISPLEFDIDGDGTITTQVSAVSERRGIIPAGSIPGFFTHDNNQIKSDEICI